MIVRSEESNRRCVYSVDEFCAGILRKTIEDAARLGAKTNPAGTRDYAQRRSFWSDDSDDEKARL